MIGNYERQNLEELRAEVACEKKFACIDSAVSVLLLPLVGPILYLLLGRQGSLR